MANYWRKRTYQQVATEPGGLAKRGFVYLMSEFFTVNAGASVHFALNTNGREVEFQFYEITTDTSEIRARLIESPATVTLFNYITPRNLNRNFPDNASASLSAASAVTGGTVIASELVGNSAKAGGLISSVKIHTLKNNAVYVMEFVNVANQNTLCHMNLGWSESDPESYRIVNPIDPTD